MIRNIAVSLAAFAVLSLNAAVVLLPGQSAGLAQVSGTGIGNAGVAYQSNAITVNSAALSIPAGTSGWLVDDNSGKLLASLNQTGLIWTKAFSVPGDVQFNVWYSLATGNGGVVGGNISALAPEYFRSEKFMLVPEPGTYALLTGLGLIGFATYRRFRS